MRAAAKPQGHPGRTGRPTPDAEHYRRHTGVPGFLYAAQNDCHQPDLFKVGYTTLSPSARVISLNDEHAKASDVGAFTLVHSVPVTASYDTEQALFDALKIWRLAPGREYFALPAAQICAAMDAAVHLGRGDLGRLSSVVAAFPDWTPAWQQRARHPTRRDATQKPAPDWGWIFVCRNQCHRGTIRRLGSTHADPIESVNALNVAQRRLTSQIGFFNLELCISVRDPPAVLNAARRSLQRFLVHPRRRFFDIDLVRIEDAIRSAASEHAATPISAAITNDIGDLTLTEWTSPMDASLAPWIFGCPSCGVSMRLTGKIGAKSILPCTACSHPLALSLSSRGATAAAVGQSS